MKRLAVLVAVLAASGAAIGQPTRQHHQLGEISFVNSGAPNAQAAFHRGLGYLHNFQYPQASKAFEEAQKADPEFVMAYWGEAMTHNHAGVDGAGPGQGQSRLGQAWTDEGPAARQGTD